MNIKLDSQLKLSRKSFSDDIKRKLEEGEENKKDLLQKLKSVDIFPTPSDLVKFAELAYKDLSEIKKDLSNEWILLFFFNLLFDKSGKKYHAK